MSNETTAPLPKLRDLTMEPADQCRTLGIQIGDTIEGREDGARGYWHEARLTLLWKGDTIAVWREIWRSDHHPEWTEPEESADWTLDCRPWRKVRG